MIRCWAAVVVFLTLVLVWPTELRAEGKTAATLQPVAGEGYWPPENMVESLLRRWAAAAAEIYDLTPDQHEKLKTQLLERWPKFLRENRMDLQPLLNEHLQARIAGGSPEAKAMQTWACRALPQLEKFSRCIADGNDEFAALLTERQRSKFEADRSKLNADMESYQARLQSWERGHFQEREWQDMTRHAEPATEPGAPKPASKADPADEFDLEMVAWDQFVRAFIKEHDLDDGQRKAAESILLEMKTKARDHYRACRVRIAVLEELIRHPKLGTTEAEIEAELIQLYGPIDDMFRQLERRLRRIPTQAQKRRAHTAVNK